MMKYIYLISVLIFFSIQGSLFQVTVLTKFLQLILLILLLNYSAIYVFKEKSDVVFLNCSLVFVVINTLYFVFSGGEASTTFKTVEISVLSVFPTFLYHKKGNVKISHTLLYLIICILLFQYFFELSAKRLENENAYGVGYIVVPIIPIAMYLFKHNKFKIYSSLIFVFTLTLLDGKRGAILASALCLFVYLFYDLKHKITFKKLLFITLVLVIFISITMYIFDNSEFLQTRLENTREGDMSGRDYIYAFFWETFINGDLLHQLFGRGYCSTYGLIGLAAHNDWLQILTDMGLLTLVIYLMMLVFMFTESIKIKDKKDKLTLRVIVCLWIIISMFSMFIYTTQMIPLFILAGMIMGDNKKHYKAINYEK